MDHREDDNPNQKSVCYVRYVMSKTQRGCTTGNRFVIGATGSGKVLVDLLTPRGKLNKDLSK